ncbi:hypothetical protein FSARC_5904 [Fusarium sarcochroum]|uniref:Uncharacterized protein n=1 Tax=Fusarium sarcochroum TaxID=1208366 RepID=A0A8H4X9M7_9HYPO|nr:hypothetical protein FSARC_5904 [Fusarium sarcochroum]
MVPRLAPLAFEQKWAALPSIARPRSLAPAIIARQLQDFLTSFSINELQPEDETLVEIITCGIALISFEVLRGSTSNWQPHLCAMASIAITIHGQLQLLQSPGQVSPLLFESKATTAMAFHIPVLLWMDLLACVATQKQPKLPYDEWLGPNCTFQLAHIMGCRNSVMKAIGDLGVLSQWKKESLTINNLDLEKFEKTRQQIEDELEDALDTTLMDSIEAPQCPSGFLRNQEFDQMRAGRQPKEVHVTRIFAAAALAQLLVVSAKVSPNSPSTRTRRAVSRAILEIKMVPQMVSPRQLSWPICVVGCMADQDQRSFFEDLLNSVLSEGTRIFGNCGTVLDVLRACWGYKIERPDELWDCGRTMKEMGICALLI